MDRYRETLLKTAQRFHDVVEQKTAELMPQEIGIVQEVERGIAQVDGLPHVQSEEMLRFAGDRLGFAFNLDREAIGCVLLDESEELQAGTSVYRTGRVLDTPV